MTGTILAMANAIGETAPLLLIGMNAFLTSVPTSLSFESATTLPTQIFIWADSPERGLSSPAPRPGLWCFSWFWLQ